MQILFRPALGDTVRVKVLLEDAPAQLLFTATFASRRDYDECMRTGTRVELWSNLDSNDRWASQPFECQPLSESTPPGTRHIYLLNSDHDDAASENTLSLCLSTTHTSRDAFDYTFRLVHPSGEVSWLGHAYNNGRIVFDRSDPYLSLHHAWSVQGTTASTLSWRAHRVADGVEVARLKSHVAQTCVVWTLGSGRFKQVDFRSIGDPFAPSKTSGCSLVIVIPRASAKTVPVLPVFVLSASYDSSISITSLGVFTFSGSMESSLLLQIFRPGAELRSFIDGVLSRTDRPPCDHFQLLECNAEASTVVFASPKNVYPASILIVALRSPALIPSSVRIKMNALTKLLSNSSRLVLYSPATNHARIFSDIECEDEITFTADPVGGHLFVGEVHTLIGRHTTWDIAVLTPHIPAVIPNNHALPTPPESPTLHPIALQHSVASTSISIASLTNADISLSEVPESVSARNRRTSTSSPIPEQTPPWSLQQSLACLVRRNLAFALAIPRLLLNLLFSSLFGRKWLLERQTGAGADESQDTGISDARNLPDTSDTRPETPSQVPVPTTTSTNELTPFFANMLDGGNVSILLRSQSANAEVGDVMVECDGTVINDLKVKEIGEGMFLIDFDIGTQGSRVKVSLR